MAEQSYVGRGSEESRLGLFRVGDGSHAIDRVLGVLLEGIAFIEDGHIFFIVGDLSRFGERCTGIVARADLLWTGLNQSRLSISCEGSLLIDEEPQGILDGA